MDDCERSATVVEDVTVERGVPVPMRDGTVLRADIYRPRASGPHPVLVIRTPYGKTLAQQVTYQHPIWYAQHGYIVVAQDTRGRYESGGDFRPYRDEAADGADTVAWAARLHGGTGQVGTYGFSYAGAVQLLAAAEQPTGLACAAPAFTSSDFYDDWTYVGGALNHAFIVSWVLQMLAVPDQLRADGHDRAAALLAVQQDIPRLYRSRPLIDLPILRELDAAPYLFDWVAHDTRDEFWQEISIRDRHARIMVPCLHIGGWYDTFIEGTLDNFVALSALSGASQQLLVGPWAHAPWSEVVGGQDFGPQAGAVVDQAQLAWFDRWLKGAPDPGEPPVRVFVLGANQWRDARSWPPEGTRIQQWYLHADRGAQSRSGDGRLDCQPPDAEPADVYVAMPGRPVPSAGGRASSDPTVVPMGPADQASVEVRNDVLVYTSAPLAEDLEVIGRVWLVLYAATDGPDCDWTAKLVDVDPSGATVNLCDGVLRARFRDGLADASPLRPNEVYQYRLRVGSTAAVLRRGHRLRLQVSSSSFPLYDVNPNTGMPAAKAGAFQTRMATQAVFHDAARPSHLLLPVLPAGH